MEDTDEMWRLQLGDVDINDITRSKGGPGALKSRQRCL
jgi:hypothetical protein